ncbi:MAG: NAD(P)/FAD-dependent oxidoreductase [Polyangiales bacterium]
MIDVREFDVVVMGGGPAGSVTAALLAQAGASVVVIERERFPRLRVGEGVAPASLAVLEGLDLRAPLSERYTSRGGTRLSCARTGRTQRFAYDDAFADLGPGWIAPRAHLDDALLRRAAELGATVVTPASVEDVLFERERAAGVRVAHPDGAREGFVARVIVDATGQESLLARRLDARAPIHALDRTAMSAWWQHAARREGDEAGDLEAVVTPHGWIWHAPLPGVVSSVGALCSAAWTRTRQRGESTDDFYARTLDDAAPVKAMVRRATKLTPARAASGFAFTAPRRAGEGWLLVGDAAGFVDPLFDSGMQLAIGGAAEAARAVLDGLASREGATKRFARYAARVRRASELYAGLAQAFYAGTLPDAMFEARTRAARQPWASILAGDVFGEDPPWRASLRARFPLRA